MSSMALRQIARSRRSLPMRTNRPSCTAISNGSGPEHSQATDGTTRVASAYLEVVGARQDG